MYQAVARDSQGRRSSCCLQAGRSASRAVTILVRHNCDSASKAILGGAVDVSFCKALMAAARERGIRAFLDVTEPEPLPDGHPLWSTPGVFITPHIGSLVADNQTNVKYRNEKVDGDKATIEIQNTFGSWETVHFVREDGVWKLDIAASAQDIIKDIDDQDKIFDQLSNSNIQP